MRTSLVIAAVILAVVIAGGCLTAEATTMASNQYVSASRELLVLTEDGQFQRAAEVLGAYQQRWEETQTWLHMLINHEDTDAVTLAMTRLEASIRHKNAAQCALYCNDLQESARHIHHRDDFTLGNVL